MREIPGRKDEEDVPSNPERRLLGVSMGAAGAAAMAAPVAASQAAPQAGLDPRAAFMKSAVVKGPATPPFLVPPPIPEVKRPQSGLSAEPDKYPVEGEAGCLPHQAWERVRKWEFDRENDLWTVNGRLFDVTRPAAVIKQGVEEVWELQGKGSWSHPIHIHFEEARILTRKGAAPPPHERGRKDVFERRPGETVRILICFEDYVGKYIMHCHNTIQEDHHMMVRFDIVP